MCCILVSLLLILPTTDTYLLLVYEDGTDECGSCLLGLLEHPEV